MDSNEQTSAPEIATPEASQQESATQASPVVETVNDRNWRALSRAKDELERKVRMQEELLTRVMHAQQAAPQPQAPDELDSIPDDDYLPKGKVKKLLEKEREVIRRQAREEAEKVLQEREQGQFMDKLKGKFSDFDEVVNPETLDLLEQKDPELARTIADLKDPYKIGLQSYKYIKSLGISEKIPSHRREKEIEKKIEQNDKTVPSPQVYEKRPMAQTFRMTETQKKELYDEMMGYARQTGGY